MLGFQLAGFLFGEPLKLSCDLVKKYLFFAMDASYVFDF